MFDYIAYIHKNDSDVRGQYSNSELNEIDTLKGRTESLEESLDENYHHYTIFAITSLLITVVGVSMISSK